MGSFANSLFTVMLGWLQSAVSAVWYAFTSENGNTLFTWIGKHWILIALVLCVIGLAADLCIYILRWKPFRVWRSFFLRRKDREEAGDLPDSMRNRTFNELTAERPEIQGRPRQTNEIREYAGLEEPDLSQWNTETEIQPRNTTVPSPAVRTASVTGAGYIVPEDSPYRRPRAGQSGGTYPSETPERQAENNDEATPFSAKRRRRINISDLFSDPQEELRPFEAPQQIIDSRKAYHEPVYPRDWKKGETDAQ